MMIVIIMKMIMLLTTEAIIVTIMKYLTSEHINNGYRWETVCFIMITGQFIHSSKFLLSTGQNLIAFTQSASGESGCIASVCAIEFLALLVCLSSQHVQFFSVPLLGWSIVPLLFIDPDFQVYRHIMLISDVKILYLFF